MLTAGGSIHRTEDKAVVLSVQCPMSVGVGGFGGGGFGGGGGGGGGGVGGTIPVTG